MSQRCHTHVDNITLNTVSALGRSLAGYTFDGMKHLLFHGNDIVTAMAPHLMDAHMGQHLDKLSEEDMEGLIHRNHQRGESLSNLFVNLDDSKTAFWEGDLKYQLEFLAEGAGFFIGFQGLFRAGAATSRLTGSAALYAGRSLTPFYKGIASKDYTYALIELTELPGRALDAMGVKNLPNRVRTPLYNLSLTSSDLAPLFDIPVKAKAQGIFSAHTMTTIENKAVKSFYGHTYKTYVIQEDMYVYRAGSLKNGLGEYFTFIKPHSELDARINSAIMHIWSEGGTSIIDTVYYVKIPKGTTIHVGMAGPQSQLFIGGTQQIYIVKPWNLKNVEILSSEPLKEELLWNLQAKKLLK